MLKELLIPFNSLPCGFILPSLCISFCKPCSRKIVQCSTHGVSFSSVQSLSRVRLFAIPWIAAHQASLSITNSQSSLRLTSMESMMPLANLILSFSTCILKEILSLVWIHTKFNKVRSPFVLSWTQMILLSPITFCVKTGRKTNERTRDEGN